MILGHKRQIEYLRKIFESQKIPHALLFSGEDGLGKKKVALEFISWIFGKSPLNHPDFILIQPIQKQIQIDQIRELKWKLSLKPSLAKLKAAILDDAHLMTKEAQNCFLKTLEEAKNSLIILISSFPKILLPTILSRCQQIKFFPVKKEEIENYLKEKKLEKEKIEKILEFSQGRPAIAISLSENLAKLEKIKEFEAHLKNLENKDIASKFDLIEKMLKEFKIDEIFQILILNFRKKFLLNFNLKHFQILKEIQKVQILTSISNLDQKLALENLFLKI